MRRGFVDSDDLCVEQGGSISVVVRLPSSASGAGSSSSGTDLAAGS